jgi:CheY-like chemotaxis protein
MKIEKTGISCPNCGWSDVRVAKGGRLLDRLLGVFAMAPLRCRKCRLRFYRPWFRLHGATSTAARPVETREVPVDIFGAAASVAEEPPKPSESEVLEPPVMMQRSVLLVDEDDEMRTMLAKLLSREGYAILHANGPGEATAEMNTNRVDAVLANLSEHQEHEVIQGWRSAHPQLSIITLSCTAPWEMADDDRLLTLPRLSSPSAVVRGVQKMLLSS